MYPKLIIDIKKLKENLDNMMHNARLNGISDITFVVKAFAGDLHVVQSMITPELHSIGDSRLENLKTFAALPVRKTLLRVPMLSEAADTVRFSDCSLNSELRVIEALNVEAAKQNKIHDIIIMFDLGDLREGFYYTTPYLEEIKTIFQMKHIHIEGIGTNLTCYGGLVPSKAVLNRLVEIKREIEQELHIKLEIISGGNSSSVNLFGKNQIPEEINHLRLGESILFGKETSYSTRIEGLHHDAFLLEAEIIELKDKPSYPDGDISINSFGEVPTIEDKGWMRRAIVAIGKQDVILENLYPVSHDIHILGGSSDHMILEVLNHQYNVGDVVQFRINYPALVHLMNSKYIHKEYK